MAKVFDSIAYRCNLVIGLLASTLALLRGKKRCGLGSSGSQARAGFGFAVLGVTAILTGQLRLRTKLGVVWVVIGLETNLNF